MYFQPTSCDHEQHSLFFDSKYSILKYLLKFFLKSNNEKISSGAESAPNVRLLYYILRFSTPNPKINSRNNARLQQSKRWSCFLTCGNLFIQRVFTVHVQCFSVGFIQPIGFLPDPWLLNPLQWCVVMIDDVIRDISDTQKWGHALIDSSLSSSIFLLHVRVCIY